VIQKNNSLDHCFLGRKDRMHAQRWALLAGAIVALFYIAVLSLALVSKPYLTFVPTRSEIANCLPKKQDLFLPFEGGRLHGWYVPGQSGVHVLVAHGNGGNVSYYQALTSLFLGLGCSVLMFDYPGFGRSDGQPSEAGCHAAARLFYDELLRRTVSPADIVLAGMSLGGAVAGRLATQVPHRALLLLSTFVSPRFLLHTLYRPLWLWSFVADQFVLEDDLRELAKQDPARAAARCLVLHSKTDSSTSATPSATQPRSGALCSNCRVGTATRTLRPTCSSACEASCLTPTFDYKKKAKTKTIVGYLSNRVFILNFGKV
jgi:pimeloyl-ACP methyl ester carboxylesterase